MRKISVILCSATLVVAMALSVNTAHSFTLLKPYAGPIKFKYSNWEEEDPRGQGNKNGVIDQKGEILHGIAKVSTISADDASETLLWYDGKDGEEIAVEFGGFAAQNIINSTAVSSVDFIDGWLNLYLQPTGSFKATYPGSGISTGTLFLSMKAVPGIMPSDSTITLRSTLDNLSAPFTGKGSGYFQVTGGSNATAFGGLGSSFFMQSAIHTADPATNFGWPIRSQDPLSGTFGCSNTIGDFIWNDLNRNGVQDQGEPGIPNVTVTLKDLNDTTIAMTKTGSNGNYLFNGLCSGTYKIVVDETTLPSGVLPTPSNVGSDPAVDSNDNPATVSFVTNSGSDLTVDFGYITPCTGKIGDLAWYDKNRNGLQDAGEGGIAGITITLKDAAATTVLATTTTDANGSYAFSGLCAGTYTVESATPTGYTPASPLVGPDRSVDSNGTPTTVALASDSSADLTVDFGFNTPCTGTIGDLVWYDQNRNGIQDAGEPGITGATVNLNVDGSPVATTLTGTDGNYAFMGLCAGTYSVEVVTPTGYLPTTANAGTDPAIDSNVSAAPVTLSTDIGADLTIDFGFVSPCTGSIGDFIWHDLNRNGIQDVGEPGMNGVKLNLVNTGSIVQTTNSGNIAGVDGAYLFSGLCPGNYTIVVDDSTLPAGYAATLTNATGSDFTNDSNGSPASISLAEGEKNSTVDIGYISPCTGTVGDFVWHDLNRNGIQDDANEGIDGVTVSLAYPDGSMKSTTTGNGGSYLFSGLCAGNYTVLVDSGTLPPGYTATANNASGSTPANDSNGSPAFVNLPDDTTNNQSIDFGYLAPCAGTIGNLVWNDVNKNGIQDAGEAGLNGITVLLKNPADNTIYATTTTDASGSYLFKGLCAGSYKVDVNESTLPSGFVATVSNASGSTIANDSNGSPALLSLPIDFSDETIDFGYYMATGKGCTLTWGYWKTHSEFGPAPYDDAWALLLNGASTPFFISGQTWYQVLQTEPRGNAYYILAHQYIAAYLNKLNGADTSEVAGQLSQAQTLFMLYKPSTRLDCKTRDTFLSLAYTLDQYNNGNIGPGHCKDTNNHHGCKDTHHEHDKEGNCVIHQKKCDEHNHSHDRDGNCVIPRRESGSCDDKSHPHDRNGKCVIKVHR